MPLLTLLVGLFFAKNLGAQTPGSLLTQYSEAVRTEKVYLAHDKPYYLPGETIWASVWLVDAASHLPYTGTPVVYVDWIRPDGSLHTSYDLQIKNGKGQLDISTAPWDTTGSYTLRAYTRYQRNFRGEFLFQKEIRLLDQRLEEKKPVADSIPLVNLRFFPEGGHLVNGITSTLGFKSTDSRNEGISVACTLLDENDLPVTEFVTLHDGMGLFRYRPQEGKSATVRVRHRGNEYRFPLPEALPEGYVIKASSRAADHHRVSISSSYTEQAAPGTLLTHCRGRVLLEQSLPAGEEFSVRLAKEELPSGLIHITVFDGQQRPVAERLVYNTNPQDTIRPLVTADRQRYPKRTNGFLTISPPSGVDSLPANLSVSIFNDTDLETGDGQLNIRNYLLLQSDLRGRINNIRSYFTDESAKTNTLRDLLLLTHGWRKFDWQDLLARKLPALNFAAEEHLTIAGKILKEGRQSPVKADVQLNVLSPQYFTALDMTTDEQGLFLFTGFDFQDTVDIVLQASVHNPRRKAKQGDEQAGRTGHRFVDINLFDLKNFPFSPAYTLPATITKPQALKRYAFTVANELATQRDDISFSVDLDEVTVTTGLNRATLREQSFKKSYEEKGVFYFGGTPKFQADDPQFADFRNGHIYELIGLVVPTAHLVLRGGRPTLKLGSPTSGTTPIIVLDGEILSRAAIDNINPKDIEVIEVMDGLFSLHYSDKGTVIQLVSKDPSEIKRPNPGITTIKHPGFYQARTFFAPKLETKEPDYRNTLYWNPSVKLTDGSVRLPFSTSDKLGSYLVWIEGLRKDGIPFIQQARFRVE